MKRLAPISNLKRPATITLGVIIALILSVGQGGYFQNASFISSVEVPSSENDDQEVVMVQAVHAIASTVQHFVANALYFISELVFADEPKLLDAYLDTPYLETYLSTIFRQIISPNAP